MNIKRIKYLIVIFFSAVIFAKERPISAPYISGDTFRNFCQFVFDEDSKFNPELVKTGDAVFVYLDYLEQFFKQYHPKIKSRYILVSHNHDWPAPGKYLSYLEDDKLFAWFTQNADIAGHPKLIPIPIGLSNKHWKHSRLHDVLIKKVQQISHGKKEILLYCNFNPKTCPKKRIPVCNFFKNKSFTVWEGGLSYEHYLHQLAHSQFVLSPHGNGLDCHRTWEALYMGSYPLVKTSTLDQLYEDLPVLIVNDWSEVTSEFLEKKFIELNKKKYQWKKLYIDYWLDIIRSYQKSCRETKNQL